MPSRRISRSTGRISQISERSRPKRDLFHCYHGIIHIIAYDHIAMSVLSNGTEIGPKPQPWAAVLHSPVLVPTGYPPLGWRRAGRHGKTVSRVGVRLWAAIAMVENVERDHGVATPYTLTPTPLSQWERGVGVRERNLRDDLPFPHGSKKNVKICKNTLDILPASYTLFLSRVLKSYKIS